MNNTLERHKFFPYIAWATIICFALFVGHLTMNVSQQISSLGSPAAHLENNL